jgi:hypothetical protein
MIVDARDKLQLTSPFFPKTMVEAQALQPPRALAAVAASKSQKS